MSELELWDERDVGDSIRLESTIDFTMPFDDSDSPADLDSSSIVITDYDGTEIVNDTLTKNASGEYYYEWDTSELSKGDYKVVIEATLGGATEVDKGIVRLGTE